MTSAMVRCHQPGCDGTIQDGYCDTCGLAPVAAELVDMANAIRPRTLT
jgi:serine/threonine-protein kinase PknG